MCIWHGRPPIGLDASARPAIAKKKCELTDVVLDGRNSDNDRVRDNDWS